MILPREECVKRWLLESSRHCSQMMYYVEGFGLDKRDPELPHDIVGPYSKFDWPVIKGCSLGYDNLDHHDGDIYRMTLESVAFHTKNQYHHQKWEGHSAETAEDDLRFGALDTICALLEHRPYYKSVDSLEELEDNILTLVDGGKNGYWKLPWIRQMIGLMKTVERPKIERITGLLGFPNIGVRPETYERIVERMGETLRMLRDEKGYDN